MLEPPSAKALKHLDDPLVLRFGELSGAVTDPVVAFYDLRDPRKFRPAIGQESVEREITVVNIEFEGSKVWVPATLVAKKGEKVRVKLINKVKSDPNVRGFAIPDFGVKVDVYRDKPETVEFAADKAGLFRIWCHLHPAHLGGQLLVLDK